MTIIVICYKMKCTCSIRRESSINSFFNDISIDKDVQSMLLPLNLMQFITFCPKYCIKNNLISPNSYVSNLVSFIGTVTFIILFVNRTYRLCVLNECLSCNRFMLSSIYFDGTFYCILFIMNFTVGIVYRQKNVQLVLTFQKVHRFLNNNISFNNFIVWNWVIVVVFICGHITFFTYFSILNYTPFYMTICFYIIISFDLNIIYASRIIKLLENKVVLWNTYACSSQTLEFVYKEHFGINMFEAYVDILECYNIYKVCFQHYILYHVMEVFVHSLVYFQVLLEVLKLEDYMDIEDAVTKSLSMTVWLIKGLVSQTILAKQCEKFYLAIESVQDSCGVILKSTCSDQEKRLCKNVLRLHRASFSKIRVCGLFYVDAALQLSLISLFVSYIVVLLQFAIL